MIEHNITNRLPRTGNLNHNLGAAARTGALPQPNTQREAQSLWLGALHLAETTIAQDPLRLAQFLDHLAQLYEANGNLAKAARLYERLTRLVEKTGGNGELNGWRLYAWRRLAALQQAQGRNYEAGLLLENALRLAESLFDVRSVEAAEMHHRLALLLQAEEPVE